MPDGSLLFDYCVDEAPKRQNSTVALLNLLSTVLPDLGHRDPCVRARAALQLDCILTLHGQTWGGLAVTIAKHGDRSTEATARVLGL